MIADITQIDDFVYVLTSTEQDYMVFANPLPNSKEVYFHIVQCYQGEHGFCEFGIETFQTKLWVSAPRWIDAMMFSIVEHVVQEKVDLENPVTLYHALGGFVRSPPAPMSVPRNLLN